MITGMVQLEDAYIALHSNVGLVATNNNTRLMAVSSTCTMEHVMAMRWGHAAWTEFTVHTISNCSEHKHTSVPPSGHRRQVCKTMAPCRKRMEADMAHYNCNMPSGYC